MGSDPNEGAVVATEFRVHGISGLRVVDASVFPFQPSGHPAANVIMIGEKAADEIKWSNLGAFPLHNHDEKNNDNFGFSISEVLEDNGNIL